MANVNFVFYDDKKCPVDNIGIPVTGNIYKETFYDQGKRYVNYYVDCAECGQEIGVHGFKRGCTVTNKIKRDGWKRHPVHNKWVCPECLKSQPN